MFGSQFAKLTGTVVEKRKSVEQISRHKGEQLREFVRLHETEIIANVSWYF